MAAPKKINDGITTTIIISREIAERLDKIAKKPRMRAELIRQAILEFIARKDIS